jgi:3-dehydroquinate dehydratase-2
VTTATTTILVLNGPNLGRLGSREPEVYGSDTLADIGAMLEASVPDGVTIELRQTDDEGELIGWLHEAVDRGVPVVLNPAAFTHYSYGLRDAAAQLKQAGVPLVEVHLSNPHSRETFRHTSVISGVASGVIAGFGADSYRLAIDWLLRARG